MSWATSLSLTVFSKSLSSWSCGLRKLGSYRPYRGTQTVGMLCAQRLDNGAHTLVRTLWSTTTFSVITMITKFSHYVTGYVQLPYCWPKIVKLVKLWPPQAPNSVMFGPCHPMLRAALWVSQRHKYQKLTGSRCYTDSDVYIFIVYDGLRGHGTD